MKKLFAVCISVISVCSFDISGYAAHTAGSPRSIRVQETQQADFAIEDGTILTKYTGKDTEVTVPPQITKIKGNCFSGDIVSITLPDGLLEIDTAAFLGCAKLESVNIPDTVTTIGFGAFTGCAALKEVKIPASVTNLQAITLFLGCAGLQKAEIACKTGTIPSGCFKGCKALEEVTLPDSVQIIEAGAFADCVSLKTVRGGNLLRIEENAFQNCTKLETISIPFRMQFVHPTAFDGCDHLKETHTKGGSFVIDEVLLSAEPPYPVYQIPAGVVTVMNNALNGSDVIAVECPDSLRYLRSNALSGNYDLLEIRLNDGCKTNGTDAIADCPLLDSLTVPSSVDGIGTQEKSRLKTIAGTPDSAAELYAAEQNYTFRDATIPEPEGDDLTLDYRKDGWAFGNSDAVFGGDYFLLDADRQYLTKHGIDTKDNGKEWSGSCVGLAITVILMKNGIFTPAVLQQDAKTLSDVQPTDAVRSFINYYHCVQNRSGTGSHTSAAQKLYMMSKEMARIPRGASPFLITFSTPDGAHGVVGYGLESGEWTFDGKNYDRRVLIWDSNYPDRLNDDACLYFESKSYDYCIPAYAVHAAKGETESTFGLITVTNDLSALNAEPYPLTLYYEKGDLNCDGKVSAADAVLLCRFLTTQDTLPAGLMQLADLSGDSAVSAADLTLLKQKLLSE